MVFVQSFRCSLHIFFVHEHISLRRGSFLVFVHVLIIKTELESLTERSPKMMKRVYSLRLSAPFDFKRGGRFCLKGKKKKLDPLAGGKKN